MDLEQIKRFIPKEGERYIFVENGEPLVVLVSFQDYQKNLKSNFATDEQETERERTTPLFREKKEQPASANPSAARLREGQGQAGAPAGRELTIEDLPF